MAKCLRTGTEIGSRVWGREPLPDGGFCCINCEIYFRTGAEMVSAKRFVDAIDTLRSLEAKANRMKREFAGGWPENIHERTTDRFVADMDDMSCRIRLVISKLLGGEG